MMKYGKIVESLDRVVYKVQTNFPSAKDKRGNKTFGNYGWTAYTHRDDPGGTTPWDVRKAFFNHADFKHLLKRPERADYDTIRSHEYNDGLAFLTAEAALECAEALEKFAVLASPYEHETDWAIPDRGLPLKVRVIEHRMAMVDRVLISA